MLKPKPGDLVVTSWFEPKQCKEFNSIVCNTAATTSRFGDGHVIMDPPMLVIAVEKHGQAVRPGVLVMSMLTGKLAYINKIYIKSARKVGNV